MIRREGSNSLVFRTAPRCAGATKSAAQEGAAGPTWEGTSAVVSPGRQGGHAGPPRVGKQMDQNQLRCRSKRLLHPSQEPQMNSRVTATANKAPVDADRTAPLQNFKYCAL